MFASIKKLTENYKMIEITELRAGNYVKTYGFKISQIEKVYETEKKVTIKGESGKFFFSVLEPICWTESYKKQILDQNASTERLLIYIETYIKQQVEEEKEKDGEITVCIKNDAPSLHIFQNAIYSCTGIDPITKLS